MANTDATSGRRLSKTPTPAKEAKDDCVVEVETRKREQKIYKQIYSCYPLTTIKTVGERQTDHYPIMVAWELGSRTSS